MEQGASSSHRRPQGPWGDKLAWLRVAGAIAVPLLLVRLVGCQTNAVADAERRWQEKGVADHRLPVQEFHSTWCYYDIDLEVRDGQVLTATVTAQYGPARGCWQYTDGVVEQPVRLAPDDAGQWTVAGLFNTARQWQAQASQKDMKVEIEFDPEWGYPRQLARDDRVVVDDDELLTVTLFEARAHRATLPQASNPRWHRLGIPAVAWPTVARAGLHEP